MHPALRIVFEKVVETMNRDDRVLAGIIQGSAASAEEDPLSDVDAVFLVTAEHFHAVDRGLPLLFESLSDELVLQWPERFNRDDHHNYAVFFCLGGRLHQFDLTLTVPAPGARRKILAHQLLFDKAGLLEVVGEMPAPPVDTASLLWKIEAFWVWMYIHAKYLARGDVTKLAYVQMEIFGLHLDVLRALDPDIRRERWWPQALKRVNEPGKRERLMSYLLHTGVEAVRNRLPGQMDDFAADARLACHRLGLCYPVRPEQAVRAHLERFLVPESRGS